jgi:hypothetical protein
LSLYLFWFPCILFFFVALLLVTLFRSEVPYSRLVFSDCIEKNNEEVSLHPLPMDTNILLIKPISYLQRAKRDELAEFCRLHNLIVGCTGRRGQSVKTDFVDAIWAYVSDTRHDVLPSFDS